MSSGLWFGTVNNSLPPLRLKSPSKGNNHKKPFEGGNYMPRLARKKTHDSIFHVMCRSISEVPLYKDDADKRFYLGLFKKYQKIYRFEVYGYCLMDNHNHFVIYANGADISKVMHAINFSYARYFNIRHGRHGHLFQDRFKSKQVFRDSYMYALSAYIHNNATDISGYENSPEDYEFSTLGVYLGLRKDPFGLVNTGFVLRMFSGNVRKARESYMGLVFRCNQKKLKEEFEFENEVTEYRSGRSTLVRNADPEKIIEFVASKLNVSEAALRVKNARVSRDARALLVILMRSLCNLKCTDICRILGNITEARVSKLSMRGMGLIDSEEKYGAIISEFLESFAS
jgi:putative transposase